MLSLRGRSLVFHGWFRHRCPTLVLIIALLACQSRGKIETAQQVGLAQGNAEVEAAISRLRRLSPTVSSADEAMAWSELAGVYTSESPSLASEMGGGFLSGSYLYLFLDKVYLLTEWADVEPETIYESGRWEVRDGLVELERTSAQKSDAGEPRLVPFVLYVNGARQLRLAGLAGQLAEAERYAGEDGEFGLLLNSLERVHRFDSLRSSRRALKKLLRSSGPISKNQS